MAFPGNNCWKFSGIPTAKLRTKRILFKGFRLLLFYLVCLLNTKDCAVMGSECIKRKYFEIAGYNGYLGVLPASFNRTLKCEMYFQWTVSDYCCYDKYDRYEDSPFCCYSEAYKLVLAVSFICLVLFIGTFSLFFCWVYNLPHHLLYIFTCGRFHLNNWMLRNKNGPYVDPSFYAGEPFWARGAEMQPYPLRPMPPKIFYPAPPPKLKYRWDASNCDIPLFIIASRQFTRNPYSARPQDRQHNSQAIAQLTLNNSSSESRRNSVSSNWNGSIGGGGGSNSSGGTSNGSAKTTINSGVSRTDNSPSTSVAPYTSIRRDSSSAPNGIFRRGSSALQSRSVSGSKNRQNPPFKVNLDEGEAAAELIEALRVINQGIFDSEAEIECLKMTNVGTNTEEEATKTLNNKEETSIEKNPKVNDEVDNDSLPAVRPNTTGGEGGNLDQFGNYVSLSNNRALANLQQYVKPNTAALNQQLNNLRLPVYSMPGVHTANVVSTVQNYHVVSSNLGNPMETILEDDSYDDDYAEDRSPGRRTPKVASAGSKSKKSSDIETGKKRVRSQSTMLSADANEIRGVIPRMDHVVVPTPTTRTIVPFNLTNLTSLPGSLSETDSNTIGKTNDRGHLNYNRREYRRNSVI